MAELAKRVVSLEQAARHPFTAIEAVHVQVKSAFDHIGMPGNSNAMADVPIKFHVGSPACPDPSRMKEMLEFVRKEIFDNNPAKAAMSTLEQ